MRTSVTCRVLAVGGLTAVTALLGTSAAVADVSGPTATTVTGISVLPLPTATLPVPGPTLPVPLPSLSPSPTPLPTLPAPLPTATPAVPGVTSSPAPAVAGAPGGSVPQSGAKAPTGARPAAGAPAAAGPAPVIAGIPAAGGIGAAALPPFTGDGLNALSMTGRTNPLQLPALAGPLAPGALGPQVAPAVAAGNTQRSDGLPAPLRAGLPTLAVVTAIVALAGAATTQVAQLRARRTRPTA